MRVLVSGATGFIGSYVIQALIQQGHQVIATSKNKEKAKNQPWFKQVEYIPLDIRKPPENLFETFGEPDCLVHLAWQGLPNYNKLYHIENNLFDSYSFLKKLIGKGLRHVAAAGTCLEYGMQNGALHEGMSPVPTTAYGVAKNSLRVFLEQLQRETPFRLDWIRLFYMYGEGQGATSILSQLDAALDHNETVFHMSGGEQLRDYMPVGDAAQTIVKIISQNLIDGIINCCSGRPISIRKLVENHLRKMGKSIELDLGHYPYPEYEPMAFWGDRSKLSRIC